MVPNNRTGVLGGTFDPPHIGHSIIARVAAERLGLGKVLLAPTETPPHKPLRRLAPIEDRIEMVRLAVADLPHVEVTRIETGPDGPFYTVDTLEKIAAREGKDAELFLVVGEDNLHELSTWKNPSRIAGLARIAVLTRRNLAGAPERLPVPPDVLANCVRIEMDPVRVSSTEVRRLIAEGGSIEGLVAPAVLEYIELKGLYKDES